MRKRTTNGYRKLETALVSLLTRIDAYRQKCVDAGQPFGMCTVHPKWNHVKLPTDVVQSELKDRATKHFQSTSVQEYYFQY